MSDCYLARSSVNSKRVRKKKTTLNPDLWIFTDTGKACLVKHCAFNLLTKRGLVKSHRHCTVTDCQEVYDRVQSCLKHEAMYQSKVDKETARQHKQYAEVQLRAARKTVPPGVCMCVCMCVCVSAGGLF
jgi:hypothetical protein